jgi:hypothetical protein
MNANEPLMTCRNLSFNDIKTRAIFAAWGRVGKQPVYCPYGVRHLGGMSLTQALIRNWRGRKVMLIEKEQAGQTCKAESREAPTCVGLPHSSEEVLVMSMERRGQLISEKFMRVTNQTGGYA